MSHVRGPIREPSRFGSFASRVMSAYDRLHGPVFAKGLGFGFVVGGMSLLFLALSVGAYLFHASPALQEAVSRQLLGFLPPEVGPGMLEGLLALAATWGSLGVITAGVFVFTAFALFDSLERTVTTMLRSRRRRFLAGRALSLLLLCATVFLFYVTAALSTLANYFSAAFTLPPGLVYWGAKAASLLLVAGDLYAIYRLFARRRLRFLRTAAVALAAALSWQLVGIVGTALIAMAGRRFLVYGAVAWAVMVMVYVRVLGEIVVVSSVMVGVLNPPGRHGTAPGLATPRT